MKLIHHYHLLELNLHEFSVEVRDIVERATKELAIEAFIAKLTSTWEVVKFHFGMHKQLKKAIRQLNLSGFKTIDTCTANSHFFCNISLLKADLLVPNSSILPADVIKIQLYTKF